jgi:hypothetical protein
VGRHRVKLLDVKTLAVLPSMFVVQRFTDVKTLSQADGTGLETSPI